LSGSTLFIVDHAQVAAFAEALGVEASAVAPPTFGMLVSAQLVEEVLASLPALDRARALHGEQSFDYLAPIRPGMRLRSTARVVADERRPTRRGGSLRRIEIAIGHDDAESGTPLVRETMVVIETEAP
jgi:acyl dehydratase